jgi:hypothetical protein
MDAAVLVDASAAAAAAIENQSCFSKNLPIERAGLKRAFSADDERSTPPVDRHVDFVRAEHSLSLPLLSLEDSDPSKFDGFGEEERGPPAVDSGGVVAVQSANGRVPPGRYTVLVNVESTTVKAETEATVARVDGQLEQRVEQENSGMSIRMAQEGAERESGKMHQQLRADAAAAGSRLDCSDGSESGSKHGVLEQAVECAPLSEGFFDHRRIRDPEKEGALRNGMVGSKGVVVHEQENHKLPPSRRPDLSINVSGLDAERIMEDSKEGSQLSPHGTPSEVVKTRVRLVKKEIYDPTAATLPEGKRKKKRVEWPFPEVSAKKRRLSDLGAPGGSEEGSGASKKVVSLDKYKAFTKAPNMLMAKLVDEGALQEGTYVQYRGKQEEVLKEGHAFKNGILCA